MIEKNKIYENDITYTCTIIIAISVAHLGRLGGNIKKIQHIKHILIHLQFLLHILDDWEEIYKNTAYKTYINTFTNYNEIISNALKYIVTCGHSIQ